MKTGSLPYLFLALALLATPHVHANYGFTLAISPEIHLQAGDVVNLPARLTNTGTQDISFDTGYTALAGQFNGLTLRPGDHLDFSYLNISAHPGAVLGVSDYQYPILGIAFPDDTTLLAAGYTDPADSTFRTRIVIDTQTYALPLNKVTEAQPGYFTSQPLDHAWIVLLAKADMNFADTQYGLNSNAIYLPIQAVPEPGSWVMLVVGASLLILTKRGRILTAGRDPR